MHNSNSWLLPDGMDEILPAQAERLECLRRKLLDTFACWGYQMVIPPFVDFLDSLLTGSGHDLDLQTFKLTDQISGKLLGVRADMTPQVARIDAHNLKHETPTRLCYTGTILHTLGDALEKNRSPMQIGAELYGHVGLESDYEIITLMLETLALSGLQYVHLDLGHVGIYRALVTLFGLTSQQEALVFEILQRKAHAELQELLNELPLSETAKSCFSILPQLNGDVSVLAKASQLFQQFGLVDNTVQQALLDLQTIANKLARYFPDLPVSFDLAELRGYHYHTGIVFAAFVPNVGKEIARGGRYDNIGKVFGRARPATGFSADLKVLVYHFQQSSELVSAEIILAPDLDDADLSETIRDLRSDGKIVIQYLSNQTGRAEDMACSAILEKQDNSWIIKPLAKG